MKDITKKVYTCNEGTWNCFIEYEKEKENNEMYDEMKPSVEKVENGYILQVEGLTYVYSTFEAVIKKLELVFGEQRVIKKKKSIPQVKGK